MSESNELFGLKSDNMKFYSQSKTPTLFDLDEPLDELNINNRWVKMADALPWNLNEKNTTSVSVTNNEVQVTSPQGWWWVHSS